MPNTKFLKIKKEILSSWAFPFGPDEKNWIHYPLPVPLSWSQQAKVDAILHHPIPQEALASFIDHTLLKPDVALLEYEKQSAWALTHNCATYCTAPFTLPLLKSSRLISVVGFPLGIQSVTSKVEETRWCLENGAREIDYVININFLKSHSYADLHEEAQKIVSACSPLPVKSILETAVLTPLEVCLASIICVNAGVHYIKTSTGFSSRGAHFWDFMLTQHALKYSPQKSTVKFKASGGIRTLKQALQWIALGADRLGTSQTQAIFDELSKKEMLPSLDSILKLEDFAQKDLSY